MQKEFSELLLPEMDGEYGYIYHLLDDEGRVLYIGQTINLLSRVGSHQKDQKIPFSKARYRLELKDVISEQEAVDILHYSPQYNLFIPSNPFYFNFKKACKSFPNMKGKWVMARRIISQENMKLRAGCLHVDEWLEVSEQVFLKERACR